MKKLCPACYQEAEPIAYQFEEQENLLCSLCYTPIEGITGPHFFLEDRREAHVEKPRGRHFFAEVMPWTYQPKKRHIL